jgi:hypothetical protein
MFFHLLYIHLFRPFLKYNPITSPLPSHVSPRKLCTQAAASVSKLMRLYKRTYGLRQICNIAVYIVHSACTIHLLNLPEKTAKRDIVHGVKHLEEIAEDWLCARRTLSILSVLARKWKIDLPEEASTVFTRTDSKYGFFSTADVPSPKADLVVQTPPPTTSLPRVQQRTEPATSQAQMRQNQLQQSLYSYLPEVQIQHQNAPSHVIPTSAPHQQHTMMSPAQPRQNTSLGNMNLPNDSLIGTIPYPRHPYNNTSTRTMSNVGGSDLRRSDSAVLSEASTTNTNTMTRQVSPSTMFGGVDALVESQDWWLRDQASLAVGFDNWMGTGTNRDMNNGNQQMNMNGNSTDVDSITGIGSGFYMPSTRNRGGGGDIYGDDDWTTYS